jgi:integrase
MRLGELLALRWEDVDLDARRVIVHRAVSAGVEGPTKNWQARFVPLADNAATHSHALPPAATTPRAMTTSSAPGSADASTAQR